MIGMRLCAVVSIKACFGQIVALVSAVACFLMPWTRCVGFDRIWHKDNGHRWAELKVAEQGRTGFKLLAPNQTGVVFSNTLSELEAAANRVLLNGSGVAAGDFDRDGLPDLFFCGLATPNVLYKNLGNWRFQDVTSEAGVSAAGGYFRGAVFADINGDGWQDLLISAVGRGVFCYLNNGQGKFNDFTAAAGLASRFGSMTLALADVDGNGTLDFYVANNRGEDIRDRGQVDLRLVRGELRVPAPLKDRLLVVNGQVIEYGEPDQLYLNDGQGHFSSVSWTNGAFLDEDGRRLSGPPLDWGLAVSFRDINADGAPDLYVCNDFWTSDRIWLNDGKGNFRAMPKLALRHTSTSSMGVDFSDIDRDGHIDFFVVDMLSRDPRLRKRQLIPQWPVPMLTTAIDGRPQFMRNTLCHNRGDGTFEEMADFAGVAASDWSWQPVFIDVDLDGYEDLLITAGHAMDVQDLDASATIQARQHSWRGYTNAVERQKAFTQELMMHNRLYPRLPMPIVAFRNQGNLKFTEVTSSWGTEQPAVHHGIALADLDGDGDLDFAVNNLGTSASIFRNESNRPRVSVRLRGAPPNTEGIGASVKLLGGAVPSQSQEIISGGRYLSGSEAILMFAAGSAQREMTLEVTWPNGRRSVIGGVRANRLYEIEQPVAALVRARAGSGEVQSSKFKVQSDELSVVSSQLSVARKDQAASPPTDHGPLATRHSPLVTRHSPLATPTVFEDVSHLLAHTHTDEPFDDFARQNLLPKKLSQLGPGVSWFDINGDGWEDLSIGSGRGGRLEVFLNDSKGGFTPAQDSILSQPITRDQTAIIGLRRANGTGVLLAGSANYEDGLALGTIVRQYDLGRKLVEDSLPGQPASTGPLAVADFDGDGDLDLFVGGRVVAGRYPEPASSLLFRNVNGRWELDAENTRTLAEIGLVSGAVWSDLDRDGFAELILACEWGPIRVLKNTSGKLRDSTTELGLDTYTGWWNGVTTGDLNGDGRLDIVASNWGLNSSYKAETKQPLLLCYGDYMGRGVMELVETEFDPIAGDLAPRRMFNPLAMAMPFLREQFATHKSFSEATLSEFIKKLPSAPKQVRVATLSSMVFFSRGNRFEGAELPREAQMAPAFSVNVGD
ncbi:MAG: VCBS repeat-containing protein, partial [Verrucomicrobiales bacterium]|nr:VCBS repeat-containing protein [Verrucomicrobiales bacterium]